MKLACVCACACLVCVVVCARVCVRAHAYVRVFFHVQPPAYDAEIQHRAVQWLTRDAVPGSDPGRRRPIRKAH